MSGGGGGLLLVSRTLGPLAMPIPRAAPVAAASSEPALSAAIRERPDGRNAEPVPAARCIPCEVEGRPSFSLAMAPLLEDRRGGVHSAGSREYASGEKLKLSGGGGSARPGEAELISGSFCGFGEWTVSTSGGDVDSGEASGQVVESGVGGAAGVPKSNLNPGSMTVLGIWRNARNGGGGSRVGVVTRGRLGWWN